MDIREFIEHFAACLSQTPAEAITAETEYKKLGEWSSIFALVVIAMVDSDFGKTIAAEDIRNCRTLRELFETINAK